MAENTSTFTGAAADGTALTAVYLTQPAANVAIGLVFAGSDLPRIVHWGRPLAKPDTLLAAYDALKPQRVSGALDDTAWPSILPTQAESWIGEQRVVLRRAGVELCWKPPSMPCPAKATPMWPAMPVPPVRSACPAS